MEQFRRLGKLIPRIRASILTDRKPDADVIEVLNLYHTCKTFHTLPRPGGALDQPFRVMLLFDAISAAESELEIRNAKKREAAQRAGNR